MVTLAETKTEFNNWISEDATVSFLEKAQAGKTTLEDIADALDEYKRLHDAGLASPAEIITLARAYPTNNKFTDEADGLDEDEDVKPMVVGGPASVELVDREGHLITTDALKKAFKKFMKNFRARNVMVMHSDVQVGHALPAYISKAGNIFKSGVDDNGLFFISELRGDTRISKRVRDQIIKGGMSSYSIAGSATKSKDIKKSDGSNVLQVDDMELAEVTICEKGVNQGAHFELLKGDKAEGSCADGSCLTSHAPTPSTVITIAKEDIPSYTEMFNDWISKAPMVGGAAGKIPKTVTPPATANMTGGVGMPVKMSMEKRKEKVNPYAIATAMAKKKGFKNFAEDSKGDKYRDKITEGIKESEDIKKSDVELEKIAPLLGAVVRGLGSAAKLGAGSSVVRAGRALSRTKPARRMATPRRRAAVAQRVKDQSNLPFTGSSKKQPKTSVKQKVAEKLGLKKPSKAQQKKGKPSKTKGLTRDAALVAAASGSGGGDSGNTIVIENSAVHHLVKDAFHEMVAGIQKQPIDYGGFQPGGTTKKKDTSKPKTTEDKAKDIASQVSMQTGGSTTGGVKTAEGSRKLDAIAQQAGSAGATTEGARASTADGRSIQRQEQLRQNLKDPDFRADQKKIADARGISYDAQIKEGQQTAKNPDEMRSIYDQVGSAQGGKLTRAQGMAPVMDRSGGSQGMNYAGSMRDAGKPGHSGRKPRAGGKPPKPMFDSPTKPKVKDIDRQVENITSNIPKKDAPATPPAGSGSGGKLKGANLSDYERATGKTGGSDKFFGRLKQQTEKPKPASGSTGGGKGIGSKIASAAKFAASKIFKEERGL